jgi:RNA 2',3'-cyclic 3'-phosphodiesterase
MPRLFSAIALPTDIKDRLDAIQQPLPGARWVAEDNLHLTLRFFGDISSRLAEEITNLLADIEVDAFDLRLQDLGTFGGGDPKSLWAGVAPNPALDILQRATERAAQSTGLAPEKRAFKAHVTLARLKGTPPEILARYLGRIGAFRTLPFTVTEFGLYSSKPKVGGGPYVLEAEFPMRGVYVDAADDDELRRWR